jgi:aminoglycoside phosphotransferase (APT) family kinase protein
LNQLSDFTLPVRVLKWVIQSVDPNASLLSVQRLYGGISSLVHRISLQVGRTKKDFVLRQFNDSDWLREEPDLALHEGMSLRMAGRTQVQAPQLVAFDETGNVCGLPAVLMTKLEGAVVLKPENVDRWVNGLAESLARIHVIKADNFPWAYFTYHNIASMERPGWSSVPELWEKAIECLNGPRPKVEECFIHRDYHPANVLWSENKVSGVVDWVSACIGPAGIDVGHCRVNLAMLSGVRTADLFLAAYQDYTADFFTYEPYWDLLSLADILDGPPEVYSGWTALGVTGLMNQLMEERLDEYLVSLLGRLK